MMENPNSSYSESDPSTGAADKGPSRKGPPPTVVARFGRMNHVGEFIMPRGVKSFEPKALVVLQTERGVEIGEPLPHTCSCSGCPTTIPREQMRSYAKASGPDFLRLRAGRVLRTASSDDLIEEKHIVGQNAEKLKTCRRLIERHQLDMKLVDCEHIFGGERIVFYFMSENRVDFRSLVKDLATEFQTRIEMRQIGARDEARLVADYETCGRECCCKNFLKTLKPVSMRMAKLQKATLDPSKVSGRCGRLKCCLRYEHDNYEDMNRRLPRVGARVISTEGRGVVVDRQIITQLMRIEGEDGKHFTVGIETLLDESGELLYPPDPAHLLPETDAESDEWTLIDDDSFFKGVSPAPEARKAVPEAKDEPVSRPQAPDDESKPRRRRRGRRGRGRGRRGNGAGGASPK